MIRRPAMFLGKIEERKLPVVLDRKGIVESCCDLGISDRLRGVLLTVAGNFRSPSIEQLTLRPLLDGVDTFEARNVVERPFVRLVLPVSGNTKVPSPVVECIASTDVIDFNLRICDAHDLAMQLKVNEIWTN